MSYWRLDAAEKKEDLNFSLVRFQRSWGKADHLIHKLKGFLVTYILDTKYRHLTERGDDASSYLGIDRGECLFKKSLTFLARSTSRNSPPASYSCTEELFTALGILSLGHEAAKA
ncbi:terpene synthase-like sequence-1,8-cineole [Striga asiatica]|uniref:Terpene synthase-like sequence-1,8-cineole n=1 Tax=Striga asiatica TaxID=4170 RepID=A0A5A7QM98_STRAF|nr:terpene synthase-like sequence-1,8-cineole [Striga asiatica]